MKLFPWILLLFAIPAFAEEITSVRIENNQAFFPHQHDLSEGSLIYVYSRGPENKMTHTAILKVSKCDLDECEAKIARIKKGGQLFTNNYYSTKNLKNPDKDDNKEKQNLIFATYGGPLTKGYNFGYLRTMNKEVKMGLKAGIINAEIGQVGVNGRYFGVGGTKSLSRAADFDFSAYFEAGYIQATLDFAKINGPEFDESVPYVGLGGEALKLWKTFLVLGRIGYAHNFFKAKYSDATADYSLPFSGGIFVLEIGAGFVF